MAVENKLPLIAVVGPTASGKTALAIEIAKRYCGEIISADSMQIYRGLDVGTAKATLEEQSAVPHHLVDILEPGELFSAADFVLRADNLIRNMSTRNVLPVVAGGTGLYVSSLLNGVRFEEEPEAPEIRRKWFDFAAENGNDAVYAKLCEVDPVSAAGIHPNNLKRVVRALEFYEKTGKPISEQKADSLPPEKPYRALLFGLNFEDRSVLYARIENRIDLMMEQGLLKEAELVYAHRDEWKTAVQAIGYKEFFPYFEGTSELAPCVLKLKQASRNYAKRQLTWFKAMKDIIWLDASAPDWTETADKFMKPVKEG